MGPRPDVAGPVLCRSWVCTARVSFLAPPTRAQICCRRASPCRAEWKHTLWHPCAHARLRPRALVRMRRLHTAAKHRLSRWRSAAQDAAAREPRCSWHLCVHARARANTVRTAAAGPAKESTATNGAQATASSKATALGPMGEAVRARRGSAWADEPSHRPRTADTAAVRARPCEQSGGAAALLWFVELQVRGQAFPCENGVSGYALDTP